MAKSGYIGSVKRGQSALPSGVTIRENITKNKQNEVNKVSIITDENKEEKTEDEGLMMRLRTIMEAKRELDKSDPGNAITVNMLRHMCETGAVKSKMYMGRWLMDFDDLLRKINSLDFE